MSFIHCAIPKISDPNLSVFQIILSLEDEHFYYGNDAQNQGEIKLPKRHFRLLPNRTSEVE